MRYKLIILGTIRHQQALEPPESLHPHYRSLRFSLIERFIGLTVGPHLISTALDRLIL